MNEDRTQIRSYLFDVQYEEHNPSLGMRYYGGKVLIRAYNREEAIEQFKERRWELQLLPQTGSIRPTGDRCTFTVEPYEEEP